MRKKSLLCAAVCTAALFGLQAGPAFAQGQAERGPDHANSICSFSGLNDVYMPGSTNPEFGRVQSYGQLVRAGLKDVIPSPGMFCNGHLFPYPEVKPPEPPA